LEIVLRAYGGLGNQFFRYAALRYYARRYNAEMKIFVEPARYSVSYGYPRPCLLSHYSITVPIEERSLSDRLLLADKALLKPAAALAKTALRTQVFDQHHATRYEFAADLPLHQHVRKLYLVGYFHTYTIVDEVAHELRTELTLKEPARGKNLELLQQISRSRSSVSLHVRRGDCTVAATNRTDLPLDYYLDAISSFKQRLGDPIFFVFSDDIPFVKKYLPQNVTTVFVEHNDDYTAHEDMRLMSSCQHHIIANSTFSWWGAWLNPRPDKLVIAPKQWYNTEDSYYPALQPLTWKLVDVVPPADRISGEVEENSLVLI
jgi:Glycosyl transferase family 11